MSVEKVPARIGIQLREGVWNELAKGAVRSFEREIAVDPASGAGITHKIRNDEIAALLIDAAAALAIETEISQEGRDFLVARLTAAFASADAAASR